MYYYFLRAGKTCFGVSSPPPSLQPVPGPGDGAVPFGGVVAVVVRGTRSRASPVPGPFDLALRGMAPVTPARLLPRRVMGAGALAVSAAVAGVI